MSFSVKNEGTMLCLDNRVVHPTTEETAGEFRCSSERERAHLERQHISWFQPHTVLGKVEAWLSGYQELRSGRKKGLGSKEISSYYIITVATCRYTICRLPKCRELTLMHSMDFVWWWHATVGSYMITTGPSSSRTMMDGRCIQRSC